MKRKDDRGSLYLITALVLGVAAGLVYGWLISPVRYVNTAPQALRSDFKDRYRVLIAEAFLSNQDIGRAAARLALLGDADSIVALTLQAQRAIAEGRPEAEIQALTYLMLALSQSDTPIQLPTLAAPIGMPTLLVTETATATPMITATPLIRSVNDPSTDVLATSPASSLAATPAIENGVVYILSEQKLICETLQPAPQLQIEIQDATGQPIPGVAITIRRNDQGSEERFFTGLKPEISLGYADFTMLPDIHYTLWAGADGQPLILETPRCPTGSEDRWGSWNLIFIQP